MSEDSDLYLDKIRLGAVFVEKDLKLIQQFYKFMSDIRQKIIEPDDERLENYPEWIWAWQNINEFYVMLKNGGYTSKIAKGKIKELEEMNTKYIELEKLDIDDLKKAFQIISQIMAACKFYDIVRKNGGGIGISKLDKRYKLAEKST
jgi:hypothetical protein